MATKRRRGRLFLQSAFFVSTKNNQNPQRGGSTPSGVRERSEGSPGAGLSSGTSVKEGAIFIYEKWRQNAGEADCSYNLHFLCQQKITRRTNGGRQSPGAGMDVKYLSEIWQMLSFFIVDFPEVCDIIFSLSGRAEKLPAAALRCMMGSGCSQCN